MKIILVDDHKILVDGMSQLLEPDHEVLATFTDADSALRFLRQTAVDLLITDYEMPGPNGVELFLAAKAIQPLLKGVLLSMHDEGSIVKQSISAGMQGFLLKNVSQQELKNALHKIDQGHTYISAELTTKAIRNEKPGSLSEREMQVLKLILKEYTNKRIADELHLSERTVETYRKNLFKKADTNNIVGLVKYAYSHRLIG